MTSAVTFLSAADPARVFQEFATIDLIAKDRAEIVVGRASFGEDYPLFGYQAGRDFPLYCQRVAFFPEVPEHEAVAELIA